jgi:hypothetical protein
MDANLTTQILETNGHLFHILESFDEQAINQLPVPGSWTVAQVANHLQKSDRFISYLLHAPTKDTQRPADEYVKQLKDTFLDFNTRMNSPEMIVPDAGPFDKESLLQELKSGRTAILAAAGQVDLARTTSVESPLGESTLLELLHFHLFHTQRHIHQLRRIRQYMI